jgi:predicted protein tyrosine phosphatase
MEIRAPFGLTICGIDELSGFCQAGASHVLSILDPNSPVPDAFGAFGEHIRLELRFDDIIEDVPGRLPPNKTHVTRMLAFGHELVAEPRANAHLLVHCHAGVSRSTASVAVILAQALPQAPASDIFDAVLRIRPQAWPNLRVVELGDGLLARQGELVSGAGELYRRQLAARPELADSMLNGGRGREVARGRSSGENQARSPCPPR